MTGFMYILECSDGTYYTGSTNNLPLRFYQHEQGEGANYTRKRRPLKLVYFEEYPRIDEAFYREKQVQGWSHAKKKALIEKRNCDLPDLSKNYKEFPGRQVDNSLTSASYVTGHNMNTQPNHPSCLFCRIIAGQAPATIVFEDAISVAFLDARPLFPGHCLLVPRTHYKTLPDLDKTLIAPLFTNVQTLVQAVTKAMNADGTFVAMNNNVSQSVPHLHIHIVPRKFKDGLRGFFWPRQKYRDQAHREDTAQRIQDALV
jgi:histidine triad (HIT) family protein